MIQQSKYGIRLSLEDGWTVDVPAMSLDHAEEVTRWHNDPTNESCYQALVIQRFVTITNWEVLGLPPRNVTS